MGEKKREERRRAEATKVSHKAERNRVLDEARAAVRRTQRVASQLHQLIAAAITVGGLRSEPELLASLAASTRDVFGAERAIVALEVGALAPLRGVALRGGAATWEDPRDAGGQADLPTSRRGGATPWVENDWLVAPILERRDRTRGVIAFCRESGSEFGTEDKEVLTLLAQMAATAIVAVELSRTMQNSEARLRVLVETAPVGIVEVELDGGVRWWNRRASRIFAWPELAGGGGAHPDFPDSALEGLQTLWTDVMSRDSVSGRDLDDVEIGTRRRELTASAALLPSTGDNAESILTLIDDVTESRELKAEVRHAHTMEVRGQVASRIAHDFNNLLTLITGYAEILARELGDEHRDLQLVRDIQTTASRASLLTSQLQTIGRTKVPEPVVFAPVAVIQSNAEVLERILGPAIDLQWSCDDEVGNVRVDADQFEQLILNLAINARDAMADGGTLRISLAASPLEGEAAAALGLRSGQYVRLAVSDTGVGMDATTREACFEPLFTTKGPFQGTGLGLAAARRFVDESGGAIWCTSTPGEGTTFEIALPVATGDAQDVTRAGDEYVRPRGSATVLLSEDDEDLRRLMSQVLQRNGYRVLEADSGEQALIVAGSFEGAIDLLLSDVVMAELDGGALARSLQTDQPSLRVLLVSGTEDESVLSDLLPGSAEFLRKPFRPSQLIDKVHDLLARRE